MLLKGKFELFGTGENYFVKDNGKLVCYVFSSSGYTSPTIDGSTLLRAVTTVTFNDVTRLVAYCHMMWPYLQYCANLHANSSACNVGMVRISPCSAAIM